MINTSSHFAILFKETLKHIFIWVNGNYYSQYATLPKETPEHIFVWINDN